MTPVVAKGVGFLADVGGPVGEGVLSVRRPVRVSGRFSPWPGRDGSHPLSHVRESRNPDPQIVVSVSREV